MAEILELSETRELVAVFKDRAAFDRAVADLLAAGFDRTDLSVLGNHDSLSVAGRIAGYDPDPAKAISAGFSSEIGLLSSLSLAGVLLLMAGPIGLEIAALTGVAAGVVALKPLFDQLTQSQHAESFAAAVAQGHILLWVRTSDGNAAGHAEALLSAAGGVDIARLARPRVEVV
jgi:hypothetical protein